MRLLVAKLLTLACIIGFSSCSKVEKMSKNAEVASKNSGRAADNSGKAAKEAAESREEIANGRMMQRSGSSSQSRRDALQAMMKAKSFEMKVTEAAKYAKAFEYQLWTGQRYDTEEYRDLLINDAMNEFFRSLVEVNGGNSILEKQISPFKMIKKSEHLNVMALAAGMHKAHLFMEEVGTLNKDLAKDEVDSIYAIIKNSLKKIKSVEAGTLDYNSLKEYEKTVYVYQSEAVNMLQNRLNMLLTLNLVKVSTVKEQKFTALALSVKWVKKLFKKSRIHSRYEKLNLAEQKRVNLYLEAASKTKFFLEEIEAETRLVPTLVTYYERLELPEIEEPRESLLQNKTLNDSEAELEEHLNLLQNIFVIENGRVL